MTVLKRNGNRELFNRNKLINGLTRACEKTPIHNNKVEVIVDELELQLQQRNIREVNSSEIGEMVLDHLKGVSEVAYVRFASVYRQFHGINDFVETLETFNSKKEQLATVV
jgi:transcriptional repressor NrdR